MKKLFAISLILVIAANAAFAEVTVGGSAVGRWQIISDTTKEGGGQSEWWGGMTTSTPPAKETGSGSIYANSLFGAQNGGVGNAVRGRVSVNASNDDGTFGASVSIRVQKDGAIDSSVGTGAWWKPLDILKATLGYMWGGSNPIGVALVDDDILTPEFYGRGTNYIPWGYEILNGAHLELTPIEGLYILASVPLDNAGNLSFNGWNSPFKAGEVPAQRIFQHTSARVAYTIANIGTVRATFWGGTGKVTDIISSTPTSLSLGDADASVLDIGFALTAIENLVIDIGFELPLAATYWLDSANDSREDLSYQVPMAVNLRANFNAGAFHIAGGVAASFAGKASYKDGSTEKSFEQGLDIGVTLNPAYDIGDLLTVGIVGDFKLDGEDISKTGTNEAKNASATHFVVLPYIQKNVNGATIYAGVRISDDNTTKTDGTTFNKADKDGIAWSIPVGFTYYF
jgi:hypothetical protein